MAHSPIAIAISHCMRDSLCSLGRPDRFFPSSKSISVAFPHRQAAPHHSRESLKVGLGRAFSAPTLSTASWSARSFTRPGDDQIAPVEPIVDRHQNLGCDGPDRVFVQVLPVPFEHTLVGTVETLQLWIGDGDEASFDERLGIGAAVNQLDRPSLFC
jgi:hypothetical protein